MAYPNVAAPADAKLSMEPPRSPWVLVPPPPLFVLAFATGLGIGRLVQLPVDLSSLQGASHVAGIAVMAAALALLASAPLLFAWRRTTIVPHRPSQSLVTEGPYRITRNPMYLGLALLYVGVSLFANTLWPLLSLALPLWILQRKTIPFEEANLRRVFGESYEAYCQHVRRWL